MDGLLSSPLGSIMGHVTTGVAIITYRWKINLVLKVEEGLQTMASHRGTKNGSLQEKKVMQRQG